MNKKEIKDVLMQVLQDTLWVDMEVAQNPQSSFRGDLGFDSLDQIEICLLLEKRLDISIPDKEADNVKTVGDVIDLLDRTINKVPA